MKNIAFMILVSIGFMIVVGLVSMLFSYIKMTLHHRALKRLYERERERPGFRYFTLDKEKGYVLANDSKRDGFRS